jgi:hypothetical protein
MKSAAKWPSCVTRRQLPEAGFASSICQVAALACLLVCCGRLQGVTLYVGPDPTAGFTTIQAAVQAAVDGDTIVLAPGFYTGPGNCDIDLTGKRIAIRGTKPFDPNTVAATVIDCAGTEKEPHRGFHIVDCNGAEISGLTITHGVAPAGGAVYCLRSTLDVTQCRIIDNAASAGTAEDPNGSPGGGLYCQDSLVWLIECQIEDNRAGAGAASESTRGGTGGSGGGICSVESDLRMAACVISRNAAGAGGDSSQGFAGDGGAGGGFSGNAIVATDCTFSYNRAGAGGSGPGGGEGGRGGGLSAESASLNRCIIEGNQAGAGGTIRVPQGTPKTDPNGTSLPAPRAGGAGGDGGGIWGAALDVANSLIVGNRAGRAHDAGAGGLFENGDGGGIWVMTGEIRHCTIAGNLVFWGDTSSEINVSSAAGLGAGVFCRMPVAITNSILYENTPMQAFTPDCNAVAYCDIMSGMCPKESANLVAEPLFVRSGRWVDENDPNLAVEPDDPNAAWVAGDYHLQAPSLCIDAGNPRYVFDPNETDLDGNPRWLDAAVDMGAYEFRSLVPVYRFWAASTSKHFYTLKETEKDKLIDQFAYTWAYEGIVYYAYLRPAEPNLLPVYRFWADSLSSHFYTIDEAEKDGLLSEGAGVWMFEGPVFYAWPEGRQPKDAKAVYKFRSDALQSYFYTIDEAEKDKLVKEYSSVWTLKGVAWYAYPEPPGSPPAPEPPVPEPVPAPVPEPTTPDPIAYEFTGGSDCAVYTVQLKACVDGREAGIDLPQMTFVPASGRMNMVVDLGSLTATLDQCHVQSRLLEHTATIRDSNSTVEIPFVVQAVGSFDATAVRGPYTIDLPTLSFPVTAGAGPGVEGEDFSLIGAVTLDGRKTDIDLDLWPTGFDAAGTAVLDTSRLPDVLGAQVDKVFRWARQEHEDPLLETTVKEHLVQLFVVSAQIEVSGLWTGKRAP